MRDVFNMYTQRLRSMQVEYTCEWPTKVPRWMRTDAMRLTQIIVNFLEHSLQRTSDGFVQLKLEQDSQAVVFTVHDSGDHIHPEELRLLNTKWSSAKDMPENHLSGPGMGVCMGKALAYLMGGDVTAINHPGKGSSLCLRLPLNLVIESKPQATAKALQSQLQVKDLVIEVLVVDDNPVNRLLVTQVIAAQWAKAKVIQADNGLKALNCLHQQKFDLVLMDMLMPEMDGIEATKHLRQSDMSPNQWIPVLGLTANISTEDHVRCLSAGMNDILLKPFDKHVLVTRIEELLLACPLFTTKHAISSGPRRVKVFV
jgi:CheY-like chemotaxis protein